GDRATGDRATDRATGDRATGDRATGDRATGAVGTVTLVGGPQPAQDLGMAAQQPRHQHHEQHKQHGLDRHQHGHHTPPPPGTCTANPSRQLASWLHVLSSTISVPLQFIPSTVAGFWQMTSRQTTSVVPWTWVLHWP